MRDLESLRKKIDETQRALHATQSARQRETDALAELWRNIRTRFDDQATEIAGYRARVSTLEDQQHELVRMIETLLTGIESSLSRSEDETIPRIAKMAEDFLASSPEADGSTDDTDDGDDELANVAELDSRDEQSGGASESRSAGIRDLISRVQQSVQTNADGNGAAAAPKDKDNLAREFSEIERLRSELHGLRKRIANSSR